MHFIVRLFVSAALSSNIAFAALSPSTLHEMFFNQYVTNDEIVAKLVKEENPRLKLLKMRPASQKNFILQGTVGSFDMIAKYGTRHAVLYYIPNSIDLSSSTELFRSLVFLHGGGESTATYKTAKEVAKSYLGDYLKYAERSKTILVFPSSSIGWNAPTRFFLRELLLKMRTDLPIDSNQIVVSGHSMGGMGLTREGNYLADLFSGIEPLSAGTVDGYAKEDWLKAYFNVQYTHINGKLDHFKQFDPDMKKVENKIRKLTLELGLPSKFKYMQHAGNHNPNMAMTFRELDALFESKRNLYQKNIFGSFYFINKKFENFGYDLSNLEISRYFWIEALDCANKPVNTANFSTFDAEISGNEVSIKTTEDISGLKKLRVNLSRKMVDFNKPVKIIWDGKTVYSGNVKRSLKKTVEIARRHADPNYLFDTYIDIAR